MNYISFEIWVISLLFFFIFYASCVICLPVSLLSQPYLSPSSLCLLQWGEDQGHQDHRLPLFVKLFILFLFLFPSPLFSLCLSLLVTHPIIILRRSASVGWSRAPRSPSTSSRSPALWPRRQRRGIITSSMSCSPVCPMTARPSTASPPPISTSTSARWGYG